MADSEKKLWISGYCEIIGGRSIVATFGPLTLSLNFRNFLSGVAFRQIPSTRGHSCVFCHGYEIPRLLRQETVTKQCCSFDRVLMWFAPAHENVVEIIG